MCLFKRCFKLLGLIIINLHTFHFTKLQHSTGSKEEPIQCAGKAPRERSPPLPKITLLNYPIWDNNRGQTIQSAMERLHPGSPSFMIKAAPQPGKYELFKTNILLISFDINPFALNASQKL